MNDNNISNDKESNSNFNVADDTTLFEEPSADIEQSQDETKYPEITNTNKEMLFNKNFDDNFINNSNANIDKQKEIENSGYDTINLETSNENIEQINGSISEREYTTAQMNYSDSLDYLDDNIKYSKYVIYIDPQNVDFIDSLTVKERKNLINKILREQHDIATANHRFKIINNIIKHVIVAILTITISIPVIYWAINTSFEATINNYRHSQRIFQTLYKENGKITNIR